MPSTSLKSCDGASMIGTHINKCVKSLSKKLTNFKCRCTALSIETERRKALARYLFVPFPNTVRTSFGCIRRITIRDSIYEQTPAKV